MVTDDDTAGRAPGNSADRIPVIMLFGELPGIPGALIVGAEHGDVVVHADLAVHSFRALVLTWMTRRAQHVAVRARDRRAPARERVMTTARTPMGPATQALPRSGHPARAEPDHDSAGDRGGLRDQRCLGGRHPVGQAGGDQGAA